MKRSTRAALAAAVVIGTTAAGALPATADSGRTVTVQKNQMIDVATKAGEACAFATTIHGEADIRTITYKDKTVTIYTHAFAVITNPANHKSVRLNTNVRFVDTVLANGDTATTSKGSAVVWGSHVGFSEDAGPGFLYLRGRSSWTSSDPTDPDAAAVFHEIKGQVTNVCDLID
jgi:hypothetical protein